MSCWQKKRIVFLHYKNFFSVNFKSLRKFKVAEHNLVGYEPLPFIAVLFMAP